MFQIDFIHSLMMKQTLYLRDVGKLLMGWQLDRPNARYWSKVEKVIRKKSIVCAPSIPNWTYGKWNGDAFLSKHVAEGCKSHCTLNFIRGEIRRIKQECPFCKKKNIRLLIKRYK